MTRGKPTLTDHFKLLVISGDEMSELCSMYNANLDFSISIKKRRVILLCRDYPNHDFYPNAL
jgi:hypothetical protein